MLPDLFKNPLPPHCCTSDHNSINTIRIKGTFSCFSGYNVSIANDWNLHSWIVLYLTNESPVGIPFIQLRPGSAVNGECFDSNVLKPFSYINNIPAVIIPSQPGFDGYRKLNRIYYGFCHFYHKRNIAQHSGTRTPCCYFSYGTAKIDINEVGSRFLGDTGSFSHAIDEVSV